MSTKRPVDVLFGAIPIGDTTFLPGVMHFDQKQDVARLLDALYERGYRQIDTARNYTKSEALLGEAGVAYRFTIHTKIRGKGNADLESAKVHASIEESLRDLKTNQVDAIFLHAPDRQTPLAETAKGMSDAISQGKFKRFGICNYTPAEVQQYLEICEEHDYTKPTVYQGHYNALVRGGEKELIPLLRKHNMAFFGFSPAAGGFFSRDTSDSARWSNDNFFGKLYNMIYSHPGCQASVPTVQGAAKKHGISVHALMLRWARFHSALDSSYGDGLIFSASKLEQLQSSLNALEEGPLPNDLVELMNGIYKNVEGPGEPLWHL